MAPGETGKTTGAVTEQPVEATGETVQATGAVTQQPVGETGETVQATEAVTKKPFYYFLPKFTSERWSGGIYDAEHNKMTPSLNIREEDLLTFNERVELETRSLVFQYQLRYSEKEYELMRKEFQKIERKANQRKASDANPDEHVFAVPDVPQPRKDGTKTGSEADDKSAADKKTSKPRRPKKADSETERKASADESSGGKPAENTPRRSTRASSVSSSELTSSTEEPVIPVPEKKGKRKGKETR